MFHVLVIVPFDSYQAYYCLQIQSVLSSVTATTHGQETAWSANVFDVK